MDLDLYRRAQRVLVHTNYEKNHLAPMLQKSLIEVVGNGIEDRNDGEAERFRKTNKITGPLILYIGRRETDKGYPLLVEAFGLLRQQSLPDATLVCMGPAGNIPMSNSPGIVHFEFAPEETKHDALAACTCLCVIVLDYQYFVSFDVTACTSYYERAIIG